MRLIVIVFAVSLFACTREESLAAAPQPSAENGLGARDAARDTFVIGSEDSATAEDVRSDVAPTKDTGFGDVVMLTDGPPPEAAPDTEAPDVLTLVDSTLPGIGDAPPP